MIFGFQKLKTNLLTVSGMTQQNITSSKRNFMMVGRVIIYCISFVFLSLPFIHGFQSSFQSAGFNQQIFSNNKKNRDNL